MNLNRFIRYATLGFAGGALGGLVNSFVVFHFGLLGITAACGVNIAPALTPQWLYPRIVWGGLWGFLFIIPYLKKEPYKRGLLLSIVPTLFQLLVFFPLAGAGRFGLKLGVLTPAFVIFFNAVWGVVAARWIRYYKDLAKFRFGGKPHVKDVEAPAS